MITKYTFTCNYTKNVIVLKILFIYLHKAGHVLLYFQGRP